MLKCYLNANLWVFPWSDINLQVNLHLESQCRLVGETCGKSVSGNLGEIQKIPARAKIISPIVFEELIDQSLSSMKTI
jgi:hypothetical protein